MLESQLRALKTRITAYFSQNLWAKNGFLGWLPGPGEVGQKRKNILPLWRPPSEPQT